MNLGDFPGDVENLAANIEAARPLWVAVSGFHDATLELLDRIDSSILVYWRLEYMGSEHAPFVTSASVSTSEFAGKMLLHSRHVVLYSFNEWNRRNVLRLLPELAGQPFRLQPIAQKRAGPLVERGTFRASFGAGDQDMMIGIAGCDAPAKGLDDLVEWIFATPFEQGWVFVFSMISERTPRKVLCSWRERFGASPWLNRIHVRQGDYSEWNWMAQFYQAVDAVLVNSRSDSWGRVVSEPIGLGTPVLVRKGDCGTNYIFPGIAKVDEFSHLSLQELKQHIAVAAARAPTLMRYCWLLYGPEVVRTRWLENLRDATPGDRVAEFDSVVERRAFGDLPKILDW